MIGSVHDFTWGKLLSFQILYLQAFIAIVFDHLRNINEFNLQT